MLAAISVAFACWPFRDSSKQNPQKTFVSIFVCLSTNLNVASIIYRACGMFFGNQTWISILETSSISIGSLSSAAFNAFRMHSAPSATPVDT